MQKGPIAPKDPRKQSSFFYVLRDKEIYIEKQQDGTGKQTIYQNDNRLINSTQIVGNVTDTEQLELLRTTEGFRKLIYAIGISVMEESSRERARFVYQMYGKKDVYGSGTNLTLELNADGIEQLIYLDSIDWKDEDYEPGQMRFEFEKGGFKALVNVRFYLREGFIAPEIQVDEPIDKESTNYHKMVNESLVSKGNVTRLQQVIQKAQKGEDTTIAFIGGSITQGAGAVPLHTKCYAYETYKAFQERYGISNNVHFIKAGIGGTSSQLGVIRFERDVLRDGLVTPDLVVVEFAVNDEGDETKGVCYESLVRKILQLPCKPAVVLLFSVFANDWNLQDRLEVIGHNYNLPMVSIKDAVTNQFRLSREEGRVLSKNQFFYDIYHPSNSGHMIMKDCLMHLFMEVEKETLSDEEKDIRNIEIIYGNQYEKIKLLDRKTKHMADEIVEGSFKEMDSDLQCVEMDENATQIPMFINNWHYDGSTYLEEAFFMSLQCKALMLIFKDSGAVDVGKAEIYVDGELVLVADPHINGWTHCNARLILQEEVSKKHKIEIRMTAEDREKKFTILGFGFVE